MSHIVWVKHRMARGLRVRTGALLLAFIALCAIFAEVIAADEPVVAFGPHGMAVLPAVTDASYAAMSRDEIAARHAADDFALWPLVKAGPDRNSDAVAAGPSLAHPFGTDGRGRDVLARVVYGARGALGFTLLAVLFSLIVGTFFGTLAGYKGGFFDELLSRPIEFIETFPTIVVVAVVRAIDPEGSVWSLLLAVIAVRWAEVARLVRSEVMRVSGEHFVMAARALGCSSGRVLRRHILPHAMGPLVVSTMFAMASIVLLEASVSFLGFGLTGSWGLLIADGLRPGAPLLPAVFGILAVGLTVLASYMLADALHEAIDARATAWRAE